MIIQKHHGSWCKDHKVFEPWSEIHIDTYSITASCEPNRQCRYYMPTVLSHLVTDVKHWPFEFHALPDEPSTGQQAPETWLPNFKFRFGK